MGLIIIDLFAPSPDRRITSIYLAFVFLEPEALGKSTNNEVIIRMLFLFIIKIYLPLVFEHSNEIQLFPLDLNDL